MPLEAMASATDLIKPSLTLQANLFQLFQPIGGVCAREFRSIWAFARGGKKTVAKTTRVRVAASFRLKVITILLRTFPSGGVRMPGSPGSMPAEHERWQYIFRASENKARDSPRRESIGREND